MNLGEGEADVHHVGGVIALSTKREGETVAEKLSLGRHEGVVLDIA